MSVVKFVITGASGSGKTSLINELAKRGFKIVHEVAQPFICEQLRKGIKEPWLKPDFQPLLLQSQLDNEASLPIEEGILFLDRGIPDILAFFKHRKQDVPEHLQQQIPKLDYEKIFFLESMSSFDKKSFRVESDREEAEKIALIIKKEYGRQGYELINIPALTIEKRADFVLKHINP